MWSSARTTTRRTSRASSARTTPRRARPSPHSSLGRSGGRATRSTSSSSTAKRARAARTRATSRRRACAAARSRRPLSRMRGRWSCSTSWATGTCRSRASRTHRRACGGSCGRRRDGWARRSVFPNRVSGGVSDDHLPFLEAGVPSIDLIDFAFPCWHRRCDDMSAVSERSVDAVGETMVELLRDALIASLRRDGRRSRKAAARRAARILRGRRPRRSDRRACARAVRAAGVRAQGDRPQQARGRAAARARSGVRGGGDGGARGRDGRLLGPRRLTRPCTRTRRCAGSRPSTPPARS